MGLDGGDLSFSMKNISSRYPIAVRTAKTPKSFGCSEFSRVKIDLNRSFLKEFKC